MFLEIQDGYVMEEIFLIIVQVALTKNPHLAKKIIEMMITILTIVRVVQKSHTL
jgi:hypothetical protein